MGFWDKVRGQFIDVIEWVDDTRDTLVWKFPRNDNEIKNGAQLVVRESQAAVFLHEGELGDVFGPGRVELKTSNIPVLTTLKSWKYAFDAPFKCDVYFVSTRDFTDLKWGTANPIMLRDAEFGPVRLRAFGTYCVRVSDPGKFMRKMAGTDPRVTAEEVVNQFRNLLVSRFADVIGGAKIPVLDLAAKYGEMGDFLRGKLQPEFEEYGVSLTKFLIENVSLPPAVEEALDKRSSMGALGNLDTFTKYQTANAIGDMAKNPGGGAGMMGVIAGLGLGNAVGGAMQGSLQPAAGAAVPPPLPGQAQWFAAIGGQQAGPFALSALAAQASGGQFKPDTLVWKQGMAGWTEARQVPELASLFAGGTTPPPLPPQA